MLSKSMVEKRVEFNGKYLLHDRVASRDLDISGL